MTDASQGGVPTALQPSVGLLNTTSMIRMFTAIIAGFLVNKGHFDPTDASSIAAALLTIAVAVSHFYKNGQMATLVQGWMQARPVKVIVPASPALLAPIAKAPVAVLAALLIMPALFGCASTPASVHLDAGKALVGAESTLDAAVTAADTAVKAGTLTAAQKASIAALTAPCPAGVAITPAIVPQCPVVGSLALARAAYAASDAASYPQLIAQLGVYAAQLTANHP